MVFQLNSYIILYCCGKGSKKYSEALKTAKERKSRVHKFGLEIGESPFLPWELKETLCEQTDVESTFSNHFTVPSLQPPFPGENKWPNACHCMAHHTSLLTHRPNQAGHFVANACTMCA